MALANTLTEINANTQAQRDATLICLQYQINNKKKKQKKKKKTAKTKIQQEKQ